YEHPAPELLERAVYGLTERHRVALRGARVIANPGCYPTAALLALLPALAAGLVGDDVIVDAKSGVSGAGHSLDEAYLFGTIDESVRAYGLPKHRHTPEIEQEIARVSGVRPRLTFTPHLVPMTRGLIATCYADLREGVGANAVRDAYRTTYGEEPFVRVVDAPPATKATLGSNVCLVFASVDERSRRLIAIAALDNLVKGAAGSAIQNMNVALGLPEDAGLPLSGMWP
ncbi:MAG TPA: N-acetyl-gamma-glutamyl-phosphate reductase, partial [Candidatus Limnocylindria bacterium]|nr:N-acetyl-gamma-glutamyl-phosphate reductase [Candidatus Limnocylindria bacterium]